jgi:hypothetical protein
MLPAQSKITIAEFSVKPGTPSTVTFTVSWTKNSIDSAWVFVDYNNSGTITRLPLSDVTASTGRAYMVDGNDRGAWVVADVSGAFSATVQLVATCRDARPCVPTGACVHAIDYPPVGKYTDTDKIKFTGTPPFYLEFDNDSPATVSTKDAQGLYIYNLESKKLKSFTDATGAPGTFLCALPGITNFSESQQFCAYVAAPLLTVTASAAAGSSLASYQWKTGTGEGTNVGTDSNSYTPTVVSTSDYWVVVTDNRGCSVTSAKATITVAGYSAGRIAGSTACGGASAGIISGIATE